MGDLQPGDEIQMTFDDAPGEVTRATVRRILSDREEALGSEVEDYVSCWLDIQPTDADAAPTKKTVMVGNDYQYYLDGRKVTILKL